MNKKETTSKHMEFLSLFIWVRLWLLRWHLCEWAGLSAAHHTRHFSICITYCHVWRLPSLLCTVLLSCVLQGYAKTFQINMRLLNSRIVFAVILNAIYFNVSHTHIDTSVEKANGTLTVESLFYYKPHNSFTDYRDLIGSFYRNISH